MTNGGSESHDRPVLSRTILAAYLAHLLVPLFFMVDSLRAINDGSAGRIEKVVAIGCVAWLVLGLGLLVLSGNRQRFLNIVSRPLITIYAVFFCVALAELGLRIGIPHFNRNPLLFKPGTKMVFDLSRWHMPGVTTRVNFSVNALGLRGPMPPRGGHVYKIITIGGSTTECSVLDDSQEWPQLLMQAMNNQQKDYTVWVGNAGVSGLTTVDHLSCLRRIPVLTQADLLIFLIGVNDLEATLKFGGSPTDKALTYRAQLFAQHAPPGVTAVGGVFKRLWLFALTRSALINLTSTLKKAWRAAGTKRPAEPLMGQQLRAGAPTVPIPDLRIGLQEYAERVRALERECRARGLRCMFLTQPSLWRADLSADERTLLWFGGVGRQGHILGYASAGDLARAMEAYNQELLNVCQQEGLECYDLASKVPKDTSTFYDDVHFNIGGSRLVAGLLAGRLLSSPPFNRDEARESRDPSVRSSRKASPTKGVSLSH